MTVEIAQICRMRRWRRIEIAVNGVITDHPHGPGDRL